MSNDTVVRRARADEAALLVGFNQAMARESEDKGLDTTVLRRGIEHLMRHEEDGLYLVAERGGEAVGCLMVTYEWSDWRNGRFWWIQSVYVPAAHRRQGVYRALHAHVREMARRDPQACGLRLYVERDNTTAMATYRALGMTETRYRLYEEEWSVGATPER